MEPYVRKNRVRRRSGCPRTKRVLGRVDLCLGAIEQTNARRRERERERERKMQKSTKQHQIYKNIKN